MLGLLSLLVYFQIHTLVPNLPPRQTEMKLMIVEWDKSDPFSPNGKTLLKLPKSAIVKASQHLILPLVGDSITSTVQFNRRSSLDWSVSQIRFTASKIDAQISISVVSPSVHPQLEDRTELGCNLNVDLGTWQIISGINDDAKNKAILMFVK